MRGAARFALVAVAGEVAVALGVLPWPEGEAFKASVFLFERWASSFGRSTPREDQEVVRRLRHVLCSRAYGL